MAVPQFAFSQRSSHQNSYVFVISFSTLFAAVSYFALSIRAVLASYEVHYFGAAVAAFLTLGCHQQLRSLTRQGDIPGNEAEAILLVLRKQAGYEVADCDFDPAGSSRNERVAQIDRLLEQVSDKVRRQFQAMCVLE